MVRATRALFETTPIQLSVIGFCLPSDHALNLSDLLQYYNANSPEALDSAFDQILAEAADFSGGGVSSFGS